MTTEMSGNLQAGDGNTNDENVTQISPPTFRVVPHAMAINMHMLGFKYATISRFSPDLCTFLHPYDANIQSLTISLRDFIIEMVPEANELIWDNYNAVALAYSKSEKLKDAFRHLKEALVLSEKLNSLLMAKKILEKRRPTNRLERVYNLALTAFNASTEKPRS